jgi:hypothetical protein
MTWFQRRDEQPERRGGARHGCAAGRVFDQRPNPFNGIVVRGVRRRELHPRAAKRRRARRRNDVASTARAFLGMQGQSAVKSNGANSRPVVLSVHRLRFDVLLTALAPGAAPYRQVRVDPSMSISRCGFILRIQFANSARFAAASGRSHSLAATVSFAASTPRSASPDRISPAWSAARARPAGWTPGTTPPPCSWAPHGPLLGGPPISAIASRLVWALEPPNPSRPPSPPIAGSCASQSTTLPRPANIYLRRPRTHQLPAREGHRVRPC